MSTAVARRLVVAVALTPIALFVLTRVGERLWLLSDSAAIDLTSRDALHGDLPLVGVYSRFGWQHPGPFLFYWLAPFVFISKGHAWGTAVGGAVLQGLAVVMVVRITKDNGVRWLLAATASILFTLVALGNDGLTIPWNPHIASAWFVVVAWTTWAIVTGRSALVGWWWVAATIVVQTHVGFTPLVAVCGVWVAVSLALAARAHEFERPSWPSVAIAVGLWVPVIADQLAGSGNLHSIARWALRGDANVGVTRAAGMVASAFRAPPAWLTGGLDVDPFTSDVSRSSVAWLVLALVAIGVIAWRCREGRARALLGLGASLAVVSVVAVAQIRDGAYAYVMGYVPATAALTVVAALVAVSEVRRSLRAVITVVLATSLVWASLGLVHDVVARKGLNDLAQADFETLLHQLPRPHGSVLLRPTGGFATLYFGFVDELDREGVDVRVDPVDADKFGDGRVSTDRDADEVWYVSESGADTDLVLTRPDAHIIASTTPLTPEQDNALTAIRRRVADQVRTANRADLLPRLSTSLVTVLLQDIPGVDQSLVAELADGNRAIERSNRCACAVISVGR